MREPRYTVRVPGKADRHGMDFKQAVRFATAEAARLRKAGLLGTARDVAIDEERNA